MMWDPELLARGRTKVGFFRDKPGRFGVLPRFGQGSEIRWFEASPFYMYHTINAWEEGDDAIVIVGCRIDDPLAGDPANPQHGPEAPTIGFLRLAPALHRWRIDLRSGKVREDRLDDTLAEFPRMDARRLGRPSRFSYHGRLAAAPTMLFDGVVKYDVGPDGGSVRSSTHAYPAGRFGGEVAFAPRVGSKGEDDGYLLTFVADEASGASELWVLDAGRVEGAPVARVTLPQRVPTGYHALWVPADEVERARAAA
jgi:carotenoid cleavage dioxygenase-like enzyme